eukprot:4568461-Alexandrium_andersonii.AAC.1
MRAAFRLANARLAHPEPPTSSVTTCPRLALQTATRTSAQPMMELLPLAVEGLIWRARLASDL